MLRERCTLDEREIGQRRAVGELETIKSLGLCERRVKLTRILFGSLTRECRLKRGVSPRDPHRRGIHARSPAPRTAASNHVVIDVGCVIAVPTTTANAPASRHAAAWA